MTLKLCKDCKYESARCCDRLGKEEIDLISGKFVRKEVWTYCAQERKSILPWHCGKNAKYFEART